MRARYLRRVPPRFYSDLSCASFAPPTADQKYRRIREPDREDQPNQKFFARIRKITIHSSDTVKMPIKTTPKERYPAGPPPPSGPQAPEEPPLWRQPQTPKEGACHRRRRRTDDARGQHPAGLRVFAIAAHPRPFPRHQQACNYHHGVKPRRSQMDYREYGRGENQRGQNPQTQISRFPVRRWLRHNAFRGVQILQSNFRALRAKNQASIHP